MSGTAEWIRPAHPVDALCDLGPAPAGLDAEERANQITHGLGFLLSLVAVAVLIPTAASSGSTAVVVGCTLYGVAMVLLYAASMLSHSFADGTPRHVFRLLDQVLIYLFIAASTTPFALVFWSPWLIATLLAGTWALATFGILRKVFVEGPDRVTLWVYVAIAFFPVLGIWPILAVIPVASGTLLVGGGLCYVIGTYFWLREGRIPYSHAVWHLFVILGTAAHFTVIQWHVATGAPGLAG